MTDSPRVHPLDHISREPLSISSLDVVLLSYRLKPEEEWPDGDQHFICQQTTSVIVRIGTKEGLTGLGGASRYRGPEAMKHYAETVIRPFLLSRNPFDVDVLAAGKTGHGADAIWAAVDTALWDLIGQAKGVPLYKLLAVDTEPVTRIPVYASGGEYSWKPDTRFDGPESLIDKAVRHKEAGYKAFKFRPGAGFQALEVPMSRHIDNIRKIRDAVGPDFDLIQESNCLLTVEQCLELAPVLEELGFLWWEEPTRRTGDGAIDNYLRVRQELKTVKVSGGEGQTCRSGLAPYVDRGAYDIVQHGCDDAGVTEAWWMARMAHQRGLLCCAHNWQGGMVTIANAHLMAAIPNRFLLESNMTPNPLKENLFTEPLVVKDGFLDIPDGPGLGVRLRDDIEDEFPFIPGPWHRPDDA